MTGVGLELQKSGETRFFSHVCQWWSACPFDCNICHNFAFGECLLQSLNSFFREKQNPKTPPAFFFTPTLCSTFWTQDFALPWHTHPYIQLIVCSCLQENDACTHICYDYRKENGRKKQEGRRICGLSPHNITVIHSHKENTPHAPTQEASNYLG